MDHEQLARQASGGDVTAFVELTRRFQHFAFGSALALVNDFQAEGDTMICPPMPSISAAIWGKYVATLDGPSRSAPSRSAVRDRAIRFSPDAAP